MPAPNDLSSSSVVVEDLAQADAYYEELDGHTLDIRKRKISTPVHSTVFVQEPPPISLRPIVDPIKDLNRRLNRQFRPDLVPPTPSPPVPAVQNIKQTSSPDPLIFDARARPLKSPSRTNEASISVKHKIFNRTQQQVVPSTDITSSTLEMSHQQTKVNTYHVPPGMMLVPIPYQKQEQQTSTVIRTVPQPSATITQLNPPVVAYNNSNKNYKIPPPPSSDKHDVHQSFSNNFRSHSSVTSTNPLLPSFTASQHKLQQQQQTDQSKSDRKKHKKQSNDAANNADRSFALYNQRNGRVEGLVKNRLNVATDDAHEVKIVEQATKLKAKWALWCSQPLFLGLTRLSGGLLFGSMAFLGATSIAGLIASIVLYTQDSVTNAQWKILGMVVCAVMLITIIITILVFIGCFKQGYMFNTDDDDDPNDPSRAHDAEGNERQKAVLRRIYKFNRPNDTSPDPSGILQDVSTPIPASRPAVRVDDKQTNTETTIALLRPKDIDRGVWSSTNAYGGIIYRPIIRPQMYSRLIQVLPHEIEESMNPPQLIYQIVAPSAAIPPSHNQTRLVQVPAQQTSVMEVIETTPKQPRIIQIPAPQAPTVEVIETTQKQPRIISIPAQEVPTVEVLETARKQPRTTVIREVPTQPTARYEYVDAEDQQRSWRIVQQPQYEIVEEIADQSGSSASEDYVEVVDIPKHARRRGRKKEKKQNFSKVSVKHVKSNVDEPRIIVENYNPTRYYE